MPTRSNPLTPSYRFNPTAGSTGRYIGADGRFVSRANVRGALDATIQRSGENVRTVTQSLRAGEISLADWQKAVAAEAKASHLASAAAAKGGWAQMTQSDYGRVGRELRDQYGRLNNFAQQIASGEQKLDGTALRRSQMYIEAGRGTFHAVEQVEMLKRGFDEQRNILGYADHCKGPGSCIEQTGYGWMNMGDERIIPIGRRLCLTHCKCRVAYRNSLTMNEAA